jgi:hypothetical protein
MLNKLVDMQNKNLVVEEFGHWNSSKKTVGDGCENFFKSSLVIGTGVVIKRLPVLVEDVVEILVEGLVVSEQVLQVDDQLLRRPQEFMVRYPDVLFAFFLVFFEFERQDVFGFDCKKEVKFGEQTGERSYLCRLSPVPCCEWAAAECYQ